MPTLCKPWRVIWPDGSESGFDSLAEAADAALVAVPSPCGPRLCELRADGYHDVTDKIGTDSEANKKESVRSTRLADSGGDK